MRRYVPALCAALISPAVGAATSAADTRQHIREVQQLLVSPVLIVGEKPRVASLASRMAERKVPGVSVAVIHEGRIEWARGFGVTRVGGPPVTENTLFQAASISKPVFALAVLHQVDAGKLSLDTDVDEYLKTWKLPQNEFTRQQKVTMRRLLSHTAGLTVHGFPGYEAGTKLPTTVEILDGTAPANTAPIRVDIPPGSQHRYSGGGYVLAQMLLGDVTGVPLPKLLEDTVLGPLGMKHSTFEQPLPAARLAEVALPYLQDGKAVPGGPHVYPEMAPAGLWTTPSDLARYALGVRAALAGNSKVISVATARDMLTAVIGSQGVGPMLGGKTSRKFFTHAGANEGYRCVMVAYEDGEGAVVMTNGDNGWEIMDQLLRTIAHVYRWPDFAPPERAIVDVEPAALDRLAGVYELDDQSIYVVRRFGGKLVGHLIGEKPVPLFPSAKDQLIARDVDVVVRFAEAGGTFVAMEHLQYGRVLPGKRVDEARTRKVMASVERNDLRIREQKQDARSEAAIRKLIAGLASGSPDYDTMSPQLAELTRRQLKGLQGHFANLGKLEKLAFQRVSGSGADEYFADFANGGLRIEIGLDDTGRAEIINLSPR